MAEFVYKARKKNGTAIQGVLEAADRMAALAQLQKQGLLPVSIEPAKKGKGKDDKNDKEASYKYRQVKS